MKITKQEFQDVTNVCGEASSLYLSLCNNLTDVRKDCKDEDVINAIDKVYNYLQGRSYKASELMGKFNNFIIEQEQKTKNV